VAILVANSVRDTIALVGATPHALLDMGNGLAIGDLPDGVPDVGRLVRPKLIECILGSACRQGGQDWLADSMTGAKRTN
jgi:hypothetical protein